MLQCLLADAVLLAHRVVNTVVFYRSSSGNDVGRHILEESRSRLYEAALPHLRANMLYDSRRDDGTIMYFTVTGDLRAISEDTVVTNFRVMRDMRTLHKEVVVADDRPAVVMRSSVDDDILAKNVIVANLQDAFLAPEIEILWQGTDDRTLVHLVIPSHSRTVEDADKREDDTTVANLYIIFDINKWENLAARADFGFRADFCAWTYFAHIDLILILIR